jgi:hypothetical protein
MQRGIAERVDDIGAFIPRCVDQDDAAVEFRLYRDFEAGGLRNERFDPPLNDHEVRRAG